MAKISELSEKLSKLNNKLKKKEYIEKLSKLKKSKLERKKRTIHLFILGNIFKTAKVDTLPEETLIGYCLNYNKVNPLKFYDFENIGKQILAEKEIRRKQLIEEYKSNSSEKKKEPRGNYKKEYSRMIKLGAIFEMTKLDNINMDILYGFIMELKNKNQYELNNYYLDGKIFKMKKEHLKKEKLKFSLKKSTF